MTGQDDFQKRLNRIHQQEGQPTVAAPIGAEGRMDQPNATVPGKRHPLTPILNIILGLGVVGATAYAFQDELDGFLPGGTTVAALFGSQDGGGSKDFLSNSIRSHLSKDELDAMRNNSDVTREMQRLGLSKDNDVARMILSN